MIITLQMYKKTLRGVGSVKAENFATCVVSESDVEGLYTARITFYGGEHCHWASVRLNRLARSQQMSDGKGYFMDVSSDDSGSKALIIETTHQGIVDSLYLFNAIEPLKMSVSEDISNFQSEFSLQREEDVTVEIALRHKQ